MFRLGLPVGLECAYCERYSPVTVLGFGLLRSSGSFSDCRAPPQIFFVVQVCPAVGTPVVMRPTSVVRPPGPGGESTGRAAQLPLFRCRSTGVELDSRHVARSRSVSAWVVCARIAAALLSWGSSMLFVILAGETRRRVAVGAGYRRAAATSDGCSR